MKLKFMAFALSVFVLGSCQKNDKSVKENSVNSSGDFIQISSSNDWFNASNALNPIDSVGYLHNL